ASVPARPSASRSGSPAAKRPPPRPSPPRPRTAPTGSSPSGPRPAPPRPPRASNITAFKAGRTGRLRPLLFNRPSAGRPPPVPFGADRLRLDLTRQRAPSQASYLRITDGGHPRGLSLETDRRAKTLGGPRIRPPRWPGERGQARPHRRHPLPRDRPTD